ncbi:hypothetical protein ACWEO2_19790 [Nocardia sp. NPDC004278]
MPALFPRPARAAALHVIRICLLGARSRHVAVGLPDMRGAAVVRPNSRC